MNINNKNLFIVPGIIIVSLLLSGQYIVVFIILVILVILILLDQYNSKRKYIYPLIKALSLLDNNDSFKDKNLKILCNDLLEANKVWYYNFYYNENYQEFYKLFSTAWTNIYIYTIINNLLETREKLDTLKSVLKNLNITVRDKYIKFDYDTAYITFINYNIYDVKIFDKLSKEEIVKWCKQYNIKEKQQVVRIDIANKFFWFEEWKAIDNDNIFYFYENCCIDIIFLYVINDPFLNKIIRGTISCKDINSTILDKLNNLFNQCTNYYNTQKLNIDEAQYKQVEKLNAVVKALVFKDNI